MPDQKPTPDYERLPSVRSPDSGERIGHAICNGILVGWAVAVIAMGLIGILCRVTDVASGDGLTRTLALVGFIAFPVFTIVGGMLGGLKAAKRRHSE